MSLRYTAARNGFVMLAAALASVLSGCSTGSGGTAGTPAPVADQTWLAYRDGVAETAALTAQYVKQWETTGAWPPPGTYDSPVLIYKGSEPGTASFPNRRRDFYRTEFDGGRELDVMLYDDGQIEIQLFWDREPTPRS